MIETRYHGYPEPETATSDTMRRLASGEWILAYMADTFEPLLIDVVSKSRYAVPHEVDGLIDMIASKNRQERYKRMRDEHGI